MSCACILGTHGILGTDGLVSGLVDSLALADILAKLEDLTHTRIPPGKVQPKDLETVAIMFATAQRVGKPLK
jgi:acyl carrier protein